MKEIVNSWWMYLLGIAVAVFVLVISIVFIIKSYKDAKAINMDTEYLKKTIISSALFTILPSISILVGVVTLSGTLGVPLPWIRLTVIGALHYEGMAATAPFGDFTMQTLTPTMFATITFTMTLGIISGPLFCLFGFKAYDKKVLSKAKQNNEPETISSENDAVMPEQKEHVEEKPKKNFGNVLFNAVFIAMISAYLVWDAVKPIIWDDQKIIDRDLAYLIGHEYIPVVVALVTFGAMALCDLLEKKCNQKWLSNFSMGLSMLVGMAVAALLALI